MDHAYLTQLKQHHPAWRLLNADSAPLIIGFLYQAFVRPNARSLPQRELVSQLDDHLYRLRQAQPSAYPRRAQQYLDDWASGEQATLRKYYPPASDEPEFDLTPATEKVIEWVQSLTQRQFVGTESRLLTIFQLLRDIVAATETDPQARLTELERRRAEIDREIARLQEGGVEPHDPTHVKERFLQAEDLARRLLSDFRQVEANFRQLDRQTRERIATSNARKGELLDEIFGEQDAIALSDQGRSFQAFWRFLMTPARHEELNELVRRVLELGEIRELGTDELLPHIKYHLMEAGEKVQRTSATLLEQLRKYLDEQVWLENRRIVTIIQDIERMAVAVRQDPPDDKAFASLDDVKPSIVLPLTRGLYIPSEKPRLDSDHVTCGTADFSTEALFEQHHVDEAVLRDRIRRMLNEASQVTLGDVVAAYPVEQGLSEVVSYLRIASEDPCALIAAEPRQRLVLEGDAGPSAVFIPTVIFTRKVP